MVGKIKDPKMAKLFDIPVWILSPLLPPEKTLLFLIILCN
jgi:hypothetical protein